jgi:6-phospho-beta-glucosidase
MKEIVAEMERLCPNALLVNYTNPVNIVSQAVADNSDARILSLCEGPLRFPLATARAASLDPARLETAMAGLNHACWTVRHLYDGEDVIPLLRRAYDERRSEGEQNSEVQLLALAAAVGAIPSTYLLYYHYRDEKLAELRAKPTTRAQDILAEVPAYWRHYAEQAEATEPELDPARSRGGIDELEIAVAVIDAIANDRPAVWPVNLRNNGAIPGLPDELVVEVSCAVDGRGARALPSAPLPPAGLGLIEMLAEYQRLAAQAAWDGSAKDALRALVSNPLVLSPTRAEAIYRELAAAQRDYLPERLWP